MITMKDIRAAKGAIKQDILASKYPSDPAKYIRGVGISWTEDGHPCIVVRIAPDTPVSESNRIPSVADGYPVLLEVDAGVMLLPTAKKDKTAWNQNGLVKPDTESNPNKTHRRRKHA